VASWGRLPAGPSLVCALDDRLRAGARIREPGPPGLAFGNGRSYGDVCLNPGGRLWRTRGLDRFLAFDRAQGIVHCEAGVLLGDLLSLTMPSGWFLPVTPGTQFVTVGGAIANDVHGKNHHRTGTFGAWVRRLRLARTDGSLVDCGPGDNEAWFGATVGGMGLTGVILDAQLQLQRIAGPWMDVETLPFGRLEEFFELARESEAPWQYTVAWIDCTARRGALGRGVFLRANHAGSTAAGAPRRPRRVPVTPPVSLVNGISLRAMNAAYYQLHRLRRGRSLQHYQPYFYPLDGLLEWNRLYGPRGFYQYQSVVPQAGAAEATRAMLEAIGDSGTGSFLAVLKVFGERASPGWMSFPMPGTTLALDFPEQGARTQRLFERLDAVVHAAGGRIYPAKDARMPRELFARGYPRREEFLAYRDTGIESQMARRLLLDGRRPAVPRATTH
jgi:FAD/FMN-containing dehydrogenase